MLLKGFRNLLVECVGGQGVMFSRERRLGRFKTFSCYFWNKDPSCLSGNCYRLQNYLQIVFLSIHQFYYSTWSGCISLAETELCRKTFSGFISDPIQRCRVGRRHYFWIQWYADLCAVVNPEFYSVYSRILNAIINSLSSYLLIQ